MEGFRFARDERAIPTAGFSSVIIGLGVSTNIHWFSDAVAGALIGYSIGKTVGKGFRTLMGRNEDEIALEHFDSPRRDKFFVSIVEEDARVWNVFEILIHSP